MIDEWAEIFGLPVRGVGIGDEAGDLAGNVGKSGKFADMRAPRIEGLPFTSGTPQ